jgi:putative sterol carrier protein
MLNMSELLNMPVEELVTKIEKTFNEHPEHFADTNVVYQFDLKDKGTYQLHLKDGKATIVQDSETKADCLLELDYENFCKFLAGKLNGTMAFMTGKLKVKGDIPKALKLESIVKKYSFVDFNH